MITYAIAEHFYSIQGEGEHTGVPQYFLRMAGCNVGKYESKSSTNASPFQILHSEYSTCTSFNGVKFVCDTDYRLKERLSADEIKQILRDSGAKHVNITGGEPFLQKDLTELVWNLAEDGYTVSIETSGTLPLPTSIRAYITCSPKKGFLKQNVNLISQFKFLVRVESDEDSVVTFLKENGVVTQLTRIFIQPIDLMRGLSVGIDTQDSIQFAIGCVKRHPEWRLSPQCHKWWGVR